MTARVEPQRPEADLLLLRLSGRWLMSEPRPSTRELEEQLVGEADLRRIAFDASELGAWDTSFLIFLVRLLRASRERGLEPDTSGLPEGARAQESRGRRGGCLRCPQPKRIRWVARRARRRRSRRRRPAPQS